MSSKEKRRPGRPSTGGRKPLRQYRCDDAEYEVIATAAELLDQTVSEFTRETLLRRARRVIAKQAE